LSIGFNFSQAFWIQFVHTISILRADRLFYYRIPIVLCIAERYIYEYTIRRMRRLTGVSIYSYPYLNILGARLDQPEIGVTLQPRAQIRGFCTLEKRATYGDWHPVYHYLSDTMTVKL
jgi:hypothetical protein